MIFKESIGEIIRLGDELVSIDDVSVNGKLASDCEEAVKKSLRLTAIPFGNWTFPVFVDDESVVHRVLRLLNAANPKKKDQ